MFDDIFPTITPDPARVLGVGVVNAMQGLSLLANYSDRARLRVEADALRGLNEGGPAMATVAHAILDLLDLLDGAEAELAAIEEASGF